MADSKWFRLYARLPVALQNVACSWRGLGLRRERYNRIFHAALAFLEKSQWWSLAEQVAYQNEQLRVTIRHAYGATPYYRQLLDGLKLTPDDIRSIDDLPKLPLLDKRTVRERYDDLLARPWPANRIRHHRTGGTTGTALRLAADVDTQPWQWAVWWRHRGRFGLKYTDPFIALAGRNVVPLDDLRPPFWRRNWPLHQTYVSIHHLLRQNMPALVEYLNTRRVAYYSGYPSGLCLLATYLLEQNLRLAHPPRITSTGAETLLPRQRETIARGLRTEVIDQYGATEQCGNISECERHVYHVDTEFGVIELLPIPGQPANVRKIVCTGFRNPAMPLIRYDIGDVATLDNSREVRPCPCGRAAPTVVSIDGRIEGVIRTPDGRQLGRLDFLFKSTTHIEEAQLVQDAADHVTVNVVRGRHFAAADEEHLRADLRTYLGDAIRVSIAYVPEIPREANGKFRQIVSRL